MSPPIRRSLLIKTLRQFPSATNAVRFTARPFTASAPKRYDGVYKELSAMKLEKPWLKALEEREAKKYHPAGMAASGAASNTSIDKPQPKRMKDSYHEIILPLAQDDWLVDTYVNSSGQLRLGSLFQDLDALAGIIAYKHTGPGPTIVTAAVDRISIITPMHKFVDLQLSGFASYVGRSSMEISIEARQMGADGKPIPGNQGLLLTCAFTMVARQPNGNGAMEISPLIVETPEEKAIFAKGQSYKNKKKDLAQTDLLRQTPNDEESDLIHQMWMMQCQYSDPQSTVRKPDDTVYMKDSVMQSTMLMQPQYRNKHSFMIFGGYLMKQTMELAFCCCSAFSHVRPTFLSLDPSTFDAPVPVGSILYLTAKVAYTEPAQNGGSRIQVRVESKVKDVEHGKVADTGVFNYTFFVPKPIKVMPLTYTEFIHYVEARRRAMHMRDILRDPDYGSPARVTE